MVSHIILKVKALLISPFDRVLTRRCGTYIHICNRSYDNEIKQTPYEAFFGSKIELGPISVNFTENVINLVQSEEDDRYYF